LLGKAEKKRLPDVKMTLTSREVSEYWSTSLKAKQPEWFKTQSWNDEW
jgi:hypothetical protein